jgi:hypothetical protein
LSFAGHICPPSTSFAWSQQSRWTTPAILLSVASGTMDNLDAIRDVVQG